MSARPMTCWISFEECDDEFYKYADDLTALNHAYILKHRDCFNGIQKHCRRIVFSAAARYFTGSFPVDQDFRFQNFSAC